MDLRRIIISACVGIIGAQALAFRSISAQAYDGFSELTQSGLDSVAQLGSAGSMLFATGLGALFYLLFPALVSVKTRERVIAAVCSFFLASTIVYSRQIPKPGSQPFRYPDYLVSSPNFHRLLFFIVVVIQLVVITCILTAFLCWLKLRSDRMPPRVRDSDGVLFSGSVEKRGGVWRRILVVLDGKPWHIVWATLGVFVCWLPVVIIMGPASVDIDTMVQLIQFRTGHVWDPMTMQKLPGYAGQDHHPFLDTYLYGAFDLLGLKLGNEMIGMQIFVILQSLVGAFALVVSLTWLRKRTDLSDGVLFVLLFFVAFMPAFPIFMTQVLKDSTWVPIFTLWTVAFFETIYRCLHDRRLGWKLLVCLLVLGILSGLTKKTGIYVTTLSMLVLIVVMRRKILPLLVSALVPAIVVMVVVPLVVLPAIGYAPGGPQEPLSVPIQQVSKVAIDHGNELLPKERETINKVLDIDAVKNNWNYANCDYAKHFGYKVSSTSKDRSDFIRVWIRLAFKYPKEYLSSTRFVMRSFVIGDSYYFVNPSRCGWWDAGGKSLFKGYEDCKLNYTQRKVALPIQQTLNKLPPFSFLGSVSLYVVWVPLVATALAIMKRRYAALYFMIPSVMTWGNLLLIPSFSNRYSVSFLFCSVLICALPFMSGSFTRAEK